MTETDGSLSFPRQSARTQRFTLGAPHAFTVAPDGSRVLFLRSRSGTDRATCLWTLDLETMSEVPVADPVALLSAAAEELSAAERARRERSRESAGGVVAYATDREVRVATFALSSRAWVADAVTGEARSLITPTPVLDPRPDPTGVRVAYVCAGALRVVGVDGAGDGALVEPDGPGVSWGLAEFVAAEEMDRHRGYWWAPDGARLLVARVDESAVQHWHLADPADPGAAPVELAYPAAGTRNAEVRLAVVDLDGSRVDVPWDAAGFPYLVTADWGPHGDPLLLVQSRDQRSTQVLAVDPSTGATSVVRADEDPAWLQVVLGVPAWLPDGRLVWVADDGDTRRLLVGGEAVTPAGLQVDAVLDVDAAGVLLSATDEPTETHLWHVGLDGRLERLTAGPGVHAGRRAGDVTVLRSASLAHFGAQVRVLRSGVEVATIPSYAETPVLTPSVAMVQVGRRALRAALLLPSGWRPGDGPLPVLLDPYGGPGAQRVLAARGAFLSSQWFADQGFAVLVVDGRGTPGRGPTWEHAIAGDLAGPPLEDQVDALHAVAETHPELDLGRVAIRGWSFGGYLAALAVLRRPDVFSAAVAGAPVTDWALYDTHYTERYLGTPEAAPAAYKGSSLLTDAARLERPLMLIHGLADDNVVAANSLRLSAALLAAGRPHTFLPLSGVTHMTSQEVVAENLLHLQVHFLRAALAAPKVG